MISPAVYAELLACDRLPSPSAVAREVLRLAHDPAADAVALGRMIATDPAISARIMRAVNAPVLGLRSPIASLEQAVVSLGFAAVARIALSFSVYDNARCGAGEFDFDGYWAQAVARATAAGVLAAKARIAAPDEAFTYGLLFDIGRLALVAAFPERYRDLLLTLGRTDRGELAAAESALFRLDAEELSARMLADWGMPACQQARQLLARGNGGAPGVGALYRVCRVADGMAEVMLATTLGRPRVARVVESLAALGLGAEAVSELFDAVATHYRGLSADLRLPARTTRSLAEIYALANLSV